MWFLRTSKLPEPTRARLKESVEKQEASETAQKWKKLNPGIAKPSQNLAASVSSTVNMVRPSF